MSKKLVLIDVQVICEPPSDIVWYAKTLEMKAKYIESWCKEFEEFIKDHRSQDNISLRVEREYQEQCEFCGYEWEIDNDGCPVCCQKAVEEYDKTQQITQGE